MRGKLDLVEGSLLRRVATLRRYRIHVQQLDSQLRLVVDLGRICAGQDDLYQLLLGVAEDEVSAEHVSELTAKLPTIRDSYNAAIDALKIDTSILAAHR